jgi:hydrogenase-4 component E
MRRRGDDHPGDYPDPLELSMDSLREVLLLGLCFLNFLLLATSQLKACVQRVALQGLVVGCLPLLVHSSQSSLHLVLLAAASIAIKAGVFPWFLMNAIREVKMRRENQPPLSLFLSLMAGVGALCFFLWLGTTLPTPGRAISSLTIPAGFFTVACGFILLIGRRLALLQVVGYLVLENGIYVLGVTLALEQPLLVETGILLDVFVAVFVMGVMVFHIQREFDHIDTEQLSLLRDRKL